MLDAIAVSIGISWERDELKKELADLLAEMMGKRKSINLKYWRSAEDNYF